VYQDSINKATREYLVNFDYLTQLLENYGFDLVTPDEAATTLSFPMPDGTATFDGVFHQMELECKNKRGDGDDAGGGSGGGGGGGWSRRCQQEYGSALYMTPEEKQISFYNRYFIFRKNRNINAKQLKSSFLSYAGLQEEQDRASAGAAADEGDEHIALEKIAKASRPIDIATKPAIAAHILAEREAEKQMEALTSGTSQPPAAAAKTTLKIKPKPKAKNAATTVKAAEQESAPIEQIEKKIQKRTKKAKNLEENESAGAVVVATATTAASGAGEAKPKRQTKKKTDL
jgi:hypothetical protein